MPERPAALAAGLAALFFVLLASCLAATGNWRAALILGAADASLNLTGPSLFESLSEAMIPGMKGASGAPAGPSLTPPPGDSGFAGTASERQGVSPAQDGSVPSEPGTEAPHGSGSTGSAGSGEPGQDAEEDEKRLKRIEMPERGRGETRMYGGSPSRAPASSRRSGPPDANSIEASFGGMIERLKSRASSGATAASLGGGKRPSGEGALTGGGDPVLTRGGGIDPKYDSPTLRALQKANSEAAHSAAMGRDPALEDGTKDHAGRGFDGNKNVRGQVPIEERKGAMGRRQVVISPEEPAELEGQPLR